MTDKPFIVKWCRGWGGAVPAMWNEGDRLRQKLQLSGYFNFGGESIDAMVSVIDTKHPDGKAYFDRVRRTVDRKNIVTNDDVQPGLVTVCTMSG